MRHHLNNAFFVAMTVATASFFLANPAQAQGHHDQGGPPTTGSGIGPGPVPILTSEQEEAVALVVAEITDALTAGTFGGPGGVFSTQTQALLAGVLISGGSSDELKRELAVGYGAGPGRSAINRLSEMLEGLFDNPYPGQMGQALKFYNQVVDNASPGYLSAPPEAFEAIHVILSAMAAAAAAAA